MMESQPKTSNSTDVNAERERIQRKVFSDYLDVVETAVGENWMLESNKSVEYGKIEQSQLQHMHNGTTVLFNLFTSLPEDHFFVEEEMLRQCVALYCCHDYHKLRDSDWGDEFEISLTEAEAFIDNFGLERLWNNYDEFAVRAIMASHHMSSEQAKKNEVPLEYLDSLYMVMLADTLASKPTLSSIGSNAQSSVSNALSEDGRQYTVKKHTLKRSLGETSMTLNRAVADCLSEYGFIPLRIYEEGCLYAVPLSSEVSDNELNKKVFETFREYIREAHPSYSLDAVESSNIELIDTKSRYYEVGYNDVLFRGLEDSINGVIKQSVADSRKMDEATPSMKRSLKSIQEILDMEFHTETRRVEGLADGIHTIYRQFTDALTEDTPSSTDKNVPKWKTERVFATLKLFGLYENEEAREKLSILKDWSDGQLEAGPHWNYKYPIAQLVFEKYCTGLSQNELTEKLAEVVKENLTDFDTYENIESEFIDGIKSELASYIGINVEIDGQNLSRFRESTDDVKAYTKNPDKQDCAICDWGTTADEYDNRLLSDESTVEVDVNVTGTGEHETVETTDNEAFCFMCQLEFSLREETTEEWGEDDVIYAKFEPEYSYIPISSWTINNFLSGLEDYNTGTFTIDSIAEDILSNEVPKPLKQLLEWDTTSQLESLIELESGFSPYVPYGGRRIPIGTMNEKSEVFEAVSAIVATSVYSGARVSISTKAMSTVEYNTEALVSIEPAIADELPFDFEGYTLSLSESEDFLRTACVMTELFETLQPETDSDPFDSKPELFSHLSLVTGHPGSRAAKMARQNGLSIVDYGKEIREIDEMFGTTEYDGLLDELTLYVTELDKTEEAKANKEFVEETLNKIAKGDISERNTQMWAENKAKERSELNSEFTERMATRYAECIDELCGQISINSERLINLQHEVGDVIEMRTYERCSSFNDGEN